jgi:hypothetical protein
MKMRSLTQLLTAGAISLTSLMVGIQPSHAQGVTFYCGTSYDGVPTTFANTPRGAISVVRWVSWHFTDSGYSPERRCQEVSGRFQTYKNNGTLNYITTGVMNGQPVVCVSGANGGGCQGLLFTLKPGSNASRVVQQLFDIRAGASGPLNESSDREYLDMNAYLESAPVVSGSAQNSQPQNTAPEPSQPSGGDSGGGGNVW